MQAWWVGGETRAGQTPYSVWEAEGEDTLLGFVLLTLHRKAEIKSEMVIE